MAIKLIKVAKELNVGLHTIVETLHSKGFPGVEEKPNADISDEMLLVLQKEFQKDLVIKQEADKLARPLLKKEPLAGAGNSPSTTSPAPPPVARPSLLPPREPAPQAQEPQPAPKKEEPVMVPRERQALRIVRKIDLNAPKPPPPPPQTPQQPEPVVREEPAAILKPQETPPKESITPAETPTPINVESEATELPPADELMRSDTPTLRGLKILGKISLEKPKPAAPAGCPS